MIKKSCFLLFFFLITCYNSFSQEVNIDTSLIKNLDKKALSKFLDYSKYIKDKDFISYKVEKLSYLDDKVDTVVMHLYNHNTKKKANRYLALYYLSKRFDTEEVYKIRKKNVIIIDKRTNEFICSKKGNAPFWHSRELITKYYLPEFIYYVPFLSSILNNPSIGYSKDSIIDGKHFKFFYYKTRLKTFVDYNQSYYNIVALCFNSQNLLESIDVNLAVPYSDFLKEVIPKRITYKFTEYSFEDRNNYYDSIFNQNNTIYTKYSKHDDKNPPYSYLSNTKDTILTDYLLDYPIVNLKGDTTTIRKEEGWLLLDFWFFGCKSCKEWIYSLKQQRDSLGYTVLENNGIKIMSINALSDNVDKIEKEMINLDAQNFSYHAKGINRYFYIKSMPYYILISPDKRIVYKTKNLGNYSELLEKL